MNRALPPGGLMLFQTTIDTAHQDSSVALMTCRRNPTRMCSYDGLEFGGSTI